MTDGHDWDHQYQETVWVWNDLQTKSINFLKAYRLDIQFMPASSAADAVGLTEALRAAGYDVKAYRNNPTVEATTSAMLLTLESIWQHERKATEIALRYGFKPDGWGFFED